MEKINDGRRKEIMNLIKKAGDPENYVTEWDDKGAFKSKEKAKVKKGGSAKARGARFELRVRKDLEAKERVVDKWTNNVDLEENKIIIAKRKFNPYSKVMTIGTGFPDFISIKHIYEGTYSVIGVEVKMSGLLSKEEKEKCAWYLKNNIFSEIWIAKQGVKKGEILYDDFREKYGDKFLKEEKD